MSKHRPRPSRTLLSATDLQAKRGSCFDRCRKVKGLETSLEVSESRIVEQVKSLTILSQRGASDCSQVESKVSTDSDAKVQTPTGCSP